MKIISSDFAESYQITYCFPHPDGTGDEETAATNTKIQAIYNKN